MAEIEGAIVRHKVNGLNLGYRYMLVDVDRPG